MVANSDKVLKRRGRSNKRLQVFIIVIHLMNYSLYLPLNHLSLKLNIIPDYKLYKNKSISVTLKFRVKTLIYI